MGGRIRVFALIALLGFMAGVIAQLTADYLFPVIISLVPELVEVKFLISGLFGACLTLVVVSVWAYVTGPPEP